VAYIAPNLFGLVRGSHGLNDGLSLHFFEVSLGGRLNVICRLARSRLRESIVDDFVGLPHRV